MIEYKPHSVQLAFHSDPAPYRWFCGGYGVGKTTVGVMEGFANGMYTHPGFVGIVAAPSYPLLMQAWFAEWCQWIPRELWTLKQDNKKGDCILLRTPTGETSTILLRSTSNPWSNEGVNAAWLVFDEAPRERSRSSFDVLTARLRRGYPGRQLGAVLTGPPQGKAHWTALEFGTGADNAAQRAGTDSHWTTGTHAVTRAQTSDNPFLPPEYVKRLLNRPGVTKAWVDQYIRALFSNIDGAVWGMFDRNIHVVPDSVARKFQVLNVCGGIDWGWTHPGVMLVGAITPRGDVIVLREEVHSQKIVSDSPDGWGPIAVQLTDSERVSQWFADPSQPNNIEVIQRAIMKLARRKANVYPADNNVGEGIRCVAALMEGATGLQLIGDAQRPRLLISDKCPLLIACIEGYTHKKDSDGDHTEQPVKKNDDPADALRYLVMGLQGC